MPSRLEARDLTVTAGRARLLRPASFHVEPGECAGVRGPSGCGKTTLLRAVAGLIDSDTGSVSLGGTAPDQMGWPRWRRQVAYVAQQPVMLGGCVRDNLARAFRYRSASAVLPESRVADWLVRLGLAADVLAQDADALSIGEQQRVALVRTLCTTPEVVLLDEPTSALDATARDAVEALLRELLDAAGLGAILVTHSAAQTERLCDRTLELDWEKRTPAEGTHA